MSKRRFFFVFRANGRLTPAIYEDEPPTKAQLTGRTVAYRYELAGKWLDMSLMELVAEFNRRLEAGRLPPGNMTPPTAKKEETRPSYEIKFQGTGEFWKAWH